MSYGSHKQRDPKTEIVKREPLSMEKDFLTLCYVSKQTINFTEEVYTLIVYRMNNDCQHRETVSVKRNLVPTMKRDLNKSLATTGLFCKRDLTVQEACTWLAATDT